MLYISLPIIVEGKYDRERVLSVAKATVITTEGFGIFKKDEKAALIRRLAAGGGVIVLTDSDGAGLVIRNYIHGILPPHLVFDIYTPEIKGKEKRKAAPSKEGLLGVEGMDREWLCKALEPFSGGAPRPVPMVTKTDFYLMGLSGGKDSSEKRKVLARLLGLPVNLSCSALIEAINLTVTRDEYEKATEKLKAEAENKRDTSDNYVTTIKIEWEE